MLNNPKLSTEDREDAVAASSLNAKLFELSQRHRMKTTVFMVAALATLTWGFTVQNTEAVNTNLVEDSRNIALSPQNK